MKYYFIAGEASGDLHAANLIHELTKRDTEADIRAWGGELMENAGAKIVKHYRDLAFMGFVEVLMNLKTILRNMKWCKQDIQLFNPDVLVLIDYPGFNLRIAEWAHNQGIKVVYYISPQIWAWKQNRIHKIKRFVDHMMVILPFEKDFYQQFDYSVEFVGHPLLDAVIQTEEQLVSAHDFKNTHNLDDRPIIALLPGSRKQEISTMLPVMIKTAHRFPDYQFVIAGAPSQSDSFYEEYTKKSPLYVVKNETYALLGHAHGAIVTSGTATLETALFDVPEVVCYKSSWISYWIARMVVKIKYISLVNLIMDREVVRELIQHDMTPKKIAAELEAILPKGHKHEKLLADYSTLKQRLGGVGASRKAAESLLKTLK